MREMASIKDLVEKAAGCGKRISDIALEWECWTMEKTPEELRDKMRNRLSVMKQAVHDGLKPGLKSASGLSGGDALKLKQAVDKKATFTDPLLDKILVKALAVSELNACMGRIVAAPTAGSCGIIPAVLLSAMEERGIPEERIIMSLFTAGVIGKVIATQSGISGAEGGCQAECGSASAMAAAALVEAMDGTPAMAANACAFVLKSTLGLVCDPIAGLVEVPCIKRNAMGAVYALAAAEMALAGIESVIPADEIIMAVKSVGKLMAPALKETAEGGLAATPTGKRLANEILS